MTTLLNIISKALKNIGALEADEVLSDNSAQNALDMLNNFIGL